MKRWLKRQKKLPLVPRWEKKTDDGRVLVRYGDKPEPEMRKEPWSKRGATFLGEVILFHWSVWEERGHYDPNTNLVVQE